MKFKNIYYRLGGKKGGFLQKQWSSHVAKKIQKGKCMLLQSVGLEALTAMQAACNECGVKFGLEFGSMLGAYREKGFIPFDDDIDISMKDTDCTRDFENVLLKYGFYKTKAFYLVGKDEHGVVTKKLTEIAFKYKGLPIDIFFTYPSKDGLSRLLYVYCNPIVEDKMTVREFRLPYDGNNYKLPFGDTCFYATSEPLKTLSLIYGDDFMTPKENANATQNQNSVVKVLDIDSFYGLSYILE